MPASRDSMTGAKRRVALRAEQAWTHPGCAHSAPHLLTLAHNLAMCSSGVRESRSELDDRRQATRSLAGRTGVDPSGLCSLGSASADARTQFGDVFLRRPGIPGLKGAPAVADQLPIPVRTHYASHPAPTPLPRPRVFPVTEEVRVLAAPAGFHLEGCH